jgi:hypothetical protein
MLVPQNPIAVKEFRARFRPLCIAVATSQDDLEVTYASKDSFRLSAVSVVDELSPEVHRAIRISTAVAKNYWADFIAAIRAGVHFRIVIPGHSHVLVSMRRPRKTQCRRWVEEYFEGDVGPNQEPSRYRSARKTASLLGLKKIIKRVFDIPMEGISFFDSDGNEISDNDGTVADLRGAWDGRSS